MVVTVATANVAPVFAADTATNVQAVEEPSAGANVTVKFVDIDTNTQVGEDVVRAFNEGTNSYSSLAGLGIVPAGYHITQVGDWYAKDGMVLTVNVQKDVKASIINVRMTWAGNVVAGGDYFVDADGDGIFNINELPIPEGFVSNQLGDFSVADYANSTLELTLKKTSASVVNVRFMDGDTFVAGGDYFVDADGDGVFNVSELPVPEGYKAETVGDFFTKDYADTALQVTVDKIAKASIINVQFMDGNKVVAGGDYFVDADGDGIFNLSELPVPEGYELSLAGDQFVKDYVGKTTQLKVKAVKAATMKVVYKDQTTQEVVGEETLTGSRQDADGNYVFDAAVDFNIPFGYQLAVDYPVETLKAGETKTTECLVTARETVLHVTFETQDGEVVGTKTVSTTSQGADGECWTFMLGTDFDLPEGYKLAEGVDQITNIQIPFGSTGGFTMIVEKEDKSSIVKAQFVDEAGVVLAGGDYFVDADGDGIFNVNELTEWLPEGYKPMVLGDFFVADYKDCPLQIKVEKIAKESIVKIQFVDAETDEVVAGGDYFVDADGDGIFNHTEVLEWVPEGYELQEFGDFQVEFYKETPLQLSVTKIAEEPENPDPEDPNKPEKPEDPDKEDTGKEDTNKKDDKKEDTKKEDKKKTSPKTGDETSAATVALPVGVSLAAILAVLVKKFK
jgi:hypothetical protein